MRLFRSRSMGTGVGAALTVAALGALLPAQLEAKPDPIPVIDLHVDLSYRSFYKHKPFAYGSGDFVADKLLSGGVRGVVLPLYVPEDAKPGGRSRLQYERSYAHVFRSILKTPPYSLPGCGIDRAGGEARQVSTWLAFEGAAPLRADEEEIRKWVLRGVRSFGLVHVVPNALSATSGRGGKPPRDTGLTEEGKRFVRLVYEAGGFIDVSHASDLATTEAARIALSLGKPIVATHSNARALAPHVRNLGDDHIRLIARTGGVVGVNFHRPYLRTPSGKSPTIEDVVRQIRHLEKMGGIDTPAIGSDFEGGISAVPELSDASRFPRLAQALRDDGMPERDIRKVFSGNARRVLCRR